MSDTMQEQVEDISMQEYFDKTIEHLASMPDQAIIDNKDGEVCSYLTPEGLKCAVGCHIPDGHEAQSSRGSVLYLAEAYPDLAGIAWPNRYRGIDLAAKLQAVHDSALNWDNGFCGWDAAEWIAGDFGLDTSFMGELKEKQHD